MIRVAIIAAMEREIRPLVQDWKPVQLASQDRQLPCFQSGDVIAVAGGIGRKRAELAAAAVVEKYRPEMLISSGLAGALIRSLKAGNIVIPSVIVDAESGEEYRCDHGSDVISGGVLVTSAEIAGADSKTRLVEKFHALVVDMEAAGVARVACEFKIKLRCVKAISDEFDFPMPPLGKFIDSEGNLQTSKFALWTALRPQYWPTTVRLAKNSHRASMALSDWLRTNLVGARAVERVVTLDTADHLKT